MQVTETGAETVVFDDIRAASVRIRPIAKRTPVMTSRGFNAQSGVQAFFKCENFQTGGAFKIRGAAELHRAALPDQIAARRGRIFLRKPRPGSRDCGARGGHEGDAGDAAGRAAIRSRSDARAGRNNRHLRPVQGRPHGHRRTRIAEETGAALVPPFNHPWIIAGQGTAALELLEEVPDLDALVRLHRRRRIDFGLLDRGQAPAAGDQGVRRGAGKGQRCVSLACRRKARRNPPPDTIADGLRTPILGELTFPIMQRNVERVVLVSEDEIRAAMKFLLGRMKILVEPSGAVCAAAVLFGKLPAGLGRVGIVLSGGNVDFDLLAGF